MPRAQRLVSLDVFRGLTIAGMVLVNCPGSHRSVYGPLRHARWHGCTPADLVFPFFLFIVGVAIAFSLGARAERGEPVVPRIVRRTLWIVGIGLLLNGAPDFQLATWRIPGVLVRIGIVYGIGSLVFLSCGPRLQLGLAVACLVGYWALLTLVPVPGQGAPSLAMGRDLGAWLDRSLLGDHLHRHARTWDPEGLLGTLPSLATCIAGMRAGAWLRRRDVEEDARWSALFAVGFLLFLAGALWGRSFPINKNLWTSSYVLYHCGLALSTLATLWWLVDRRGQRWWTPPFVWLGVNPLTIYVAHTALAIGLRRIPVGQGTAWSWAYEALFGGWLAPQRASLAFALAMLAIQVLIARALYVRGIVLRA